MFVIKYLCRHFVKIYIKSANQVKRYKETDYKVRLLRHNTLGNSPTDPLRWSVITIRPNKPYCYILSYKTTSVVYKVNFEIYRLTFTSTNY